MEKGYESMREEIKRLHRVCQAKSNLLDESRSVMRLYRAFFAGKISKEREKDIDLLISKINESLD